MSISDRPGLAAGFVGGALSASNGSGFLGALLAGFLAGFIVNWLKKALSVLPASLEGTKPILFYPLLGVLIIGLICNFVIGPPVAGINEALKNTLANMDPSAKLVMGAVIGGMMAVDMGGPLNKAAYVTGVGLLARQLLRYRGGYGGRHGSPDCHCSCYDFLQRQIHQERTENYCDQYHNGLVVHH